MSEAMTGAYSTAITGIQTDVTGLITTALPVALGIVGIFIAVKLGIRFFKSVAR